LAIPRLALALWAALLLCALLGARRAEAQSCHAPILTRQDELHAWRATAGFLAASYDHGGAQRGNYQGLYAGLAYRHPRVGVSALVPAYRLDRGGEVELGLGDATLSVSGTLLRARDDALTFGVELPTMVPTGSASRSLGMGHVMLMPALWLAFERPPFALRVEAGYGRGLGDATEHGEHGAHEHGERVRPSPIVNPMNRSEFEHALSMVLGVQRHLFVHARWFGAVPIADDLGILRQIVGAGATLRFHAAEVSAELQVPLAGNAFDVKGLLQVSALF
jgi:hypothetical protein